MKTFEQWWEEQDPHHCISTKEWCRRAWGELELKVQALLKLQKTQYELDEMPDWEAMYHELKSSVSAREQALEQALRYAREALFFWKERLSLVDMVDEPKDWSKPIKRTESVLKSITALLEKGK